MNAIVSYAYVVNKNDFWGVVRQVRDYYKANHILYNLSFNAHDEMTPEQKYETAVGVLMNFKGHGAEIQLFDKNANQYAFRVLERNYFFVDAFKANDWKIQSRFYDSQAELVVLKEKSSLELAEWIDTKVNVQEYFIVPIMTIETLMSYYFEQLMSKHNVNPINSL